MNAELRERIFESVERKTKRQNGLFLAKGQCMMLEKGRVVPIHAAHIFWNDGKKRYTWRYDSESQINTLPQEVYEFIFQKASQMIVATGIKGSQELEIKNKFFYGVDDEDDPITFLTMLEREFDYILLYANHATKTPLIPLLYYKDDDRGRLLFFSLMQLLASVEEELNDEEITELF